MTQVGARTTNLALLAVLAVSFLTGAMAFATGAHWGGVIVVAHGVAGFAVVALAPWKSPIMQRGMVHHRRGRAASIALALLLVLSIAAGLLHAAGVRRLPAFNAMQWHVGAALAAAPLVAWHVIARPVRPRPSDLSRRALLRTGVLAGGAGVAWLGFEGALQVAGLRGRDRRFTGSHEAGSGDPSAMPVTQWLDDDVPVVDDAAWRLVVETGSGRRSLSYDEVAASHDRRVAVLDCTGGWWAEQEWEGVPLRRLIPDDEDARSVLVRSVTGYSRRFAVDDLDDIVLATRVGGAALTPGHGYPARLVAPGRRGFWWVKWVEEIRLEATPWWWQPPFPLT